MACKQQYVAMRQHHEYSGACIPCLEEKIDKMLKMLETLQKQANTIEEQVVPKIEEIVDNS